MGGGWWWGCLPRPVCSPAQCRSRAVAVEFAAGSVWSFGSRVCWRGGIVITGGRTGSLVAAGGDTVELRATLLRSVRWQMTTTTTTTVLPAATYLPSTSRSTSTRCLQSGAHESRQQ